ncbi:MAG: ImuA family protein [Rubrimonas sp.]|uniref:ImuA family protein n=1 Tax=Rubrimonas sp. TaxID=2036015 RepID=UPI002FDD2F5A
MAQNPTGRLALSSDGPHLALGRAHEAFGPSRRVLAAMAAARLAGPVIWIRGPWAEGAPCADGLAGFFDPGRIVLVECRRGVEALWAAEEALRSGAAPLVALEPDAPPALTPVRRLTLAAQASMRGGARAPAPPLCLILTPTGGAAPAVQTRWRVDPLPGWARAGGAPRWRLELLRDKAGPPDAWEACGPPPRRALGLARLGPQFRRAA